MEAETHSLAVLPPRRRGPYTNKFRSVEIVSNHYETTLRGIQRIVVYSMACTPRIQGKAKDIIDSIVKQMRPIVERQIKNPVFRGFCVFSEHQCKEPIKHTVMGPHGSIDVEITLRKVHEVAKSPKVFFLFLNNSLRSIMSRLGYVEIGHTGKYFDLSKEKLLDSLKMYKGFSSSFVQSQKGMFLRVDTARKIVRKDTALQAIDEVYKKGSTMDKEERRNAVRSMLINNIVMTSYGRPAFYRVLDIDFNPARMNTPVGADCPDLPSYFLKKYDIVIKNPQQPCLIVENKIRRREIVGSEQGPTLLPPELCLMTGIPQNFDENRRKNISAETILQPSDKFREIEGFVTQLEKAKEIEKLQQIGINLNKKMHRFQTKLIAAPALELGKNNFIQKGKQAFFNLFDKPLFSGKHGIIVHIIHNKGADVKGMVQTFTKTSERLAVSVKVTSQEMQLFRDRDVLEAMDKAVRHNEEINLLMVVIPLKLKPDYPKFKQATLSTKPNHEMITQFVVENTLRKKGVQSIHTKLLLQMCAKRGNILWVPSYSQEMNDVLDKVMIIGLDSANSKGNNIMAAVGTINSTFSLMTSSTISIAEGDKKYASMLVVTTKCIENYVARNKCPPKEIVIFQNSSPGDQINLCQQEFAKPLQRTLDANHQSGVNVTVVMVNLKNSERFFSVGNDVRNVQPGTLVNSQIVSKDYDFFIVSQQSTKGSVVPNHFKVINCDKSKLQEGHLEELIFSQCFNYVNWSGSIKIPGILQYAKKCAKFNSEIMTGKPVNSSVFTKLYYI